jgi:hypothetical protein
MVLSEMPKAELEETLASLKRLFDVSRRDYEKKYMQYEELSRDLNSLSETIKSIKGSMAAVERALGLSPEQIRLPDTPEVRQVGKPVGVTEAAMRLVAAKNESGGIAFDEILRALHEQGYKTLTREYLHTVLNRKKNYQKRLDRIDGKWFLTEKGKQELGLEI